MQTIENSIVFSKDVAVAIGLPAAILLRKIVEGVDAAEIQDAGKLVEGRRWIRCSVKQWNDALPFYDQKTIQRALGRLKELGVLFSRNLNDDQRDRINWYAVNRDGLIRVDARIRGHSDT